MCIVQGIAESLVIEAVAGNHGETLEIVAEFTLGSAERFGLHLRENRDQHTVVGYDTTRSGSLYIGRTAAGSGEIHDAFPAVHHGPLVAEDGRVRLRIYVDTTSVELFRGRGQRVLTDQIFPDDDSRAATSAPKVATSPSATSTQHP